MFIRRSIALSFLSLDSATERTERVLLDVVPKKGIPIQPHWAARLAEAITFGLMGISLEKRDRLFRSQGEPHVRERDLTAPYGHIQGCPS
jgi:hypothetical protein